MSTLTEILQDFSPLSNYINSCKPGQIFFIVDENTHEYCLPKILFNLETEIPFEIIEIESGENLKTLETAAQLYEILADFTAGRDALIVNVGGGVITDLGGFVASTYKRGLRFINIPTTLLAMCDASLGGKNGVNLSSIKNCVGTFNEAEQVFVHPGFLKTLPDDELLSGFAEMMKHGLIADSNHYQNLIHINTNELLEVSAHILHSAKIKEEIVERDPFEKNERKKLNFGHTIGHALESLMLHKISPVPHGFAVAAGMICENFIATEKGILNSKVRDEVNSQLLKTFPKLEFSENDTPYIYEMLKNDKKNSSQTVRMSLITEIGNCKTDILVSLDEISASLDYYRSL